MLSTSRILVLGAIGCVVVASFAWLPTNTSAVSKTAITSQPAKQAKPERIQVGGIYQTAFSFIWPKDVDDIIFNAAGEFNGKQYASLLIENKAVLFPKARAVKVLERRNLGANGRWARCRLVRHPKAGEAWVVEQYLIEPTDYELLAASPEEYDRIMESRGEWAKK